MKNLLLIAIILSLAPQMSHAQQQDTVKRSDGSQHSASSAKTKVKIKNAANYTDLASYLPGRVAGVTISGPAGSRVVIIRGISSFYGEPGALIIVDGIEMDSFESANNSVNIQDIESVEVIKDGAEYGVKGANGVVIITTKSGGKENGDENGDGDNSQQQ